MTDLKALIAKHWKNEELNLPAGRHQFDEEFVVRVRACARQFVQDDWS